MTERKEYFRSYHAKNKDRFKRITLRLESSDYNSLEEAAKMRGRKLAPHLRSLVLHSHRNQVELPLEVEQNLKELDRLIRNVANNVNQIARYSNRFREVLDANEPLREIANLHTILTEKIEEIAKSKQENDN